MEDRFESRYGEFRSEGSTMRLARVKSRARGGVDQITGLLDEAESLLAGGRGRDAIDLLAAADRREPDSRIEARLIRIRYEAFASLTRSSTVEAWPPEAEDLFPHSIGLPEVDLRGLSAGVIRSAIVRNGGLVVRGLIDDERSSMLRADIDRAFDAHDAAQDGAPVSQTAPWYSPVEGDLGNKIAMLRPWIRGGGGVLTVESPRASRDIINVFEDLGVIPMIAEHLGERPALSVKKWTLRRVPVDSGTNWHQDGAFLGDGIRTVNVWVTLTDCGVDSPSLDVVPRRVEEILPTGTEGAVFNWSIGEPVVAATGAAVPEQRLVLAAGDAVLFDDRLVHRTAVGPGMTRERYAIESWFFAPSRYPSDQLPIVV